MKLPRRLKPPVLLIIAFAALASCKSEQSMQQAMKKICAGPPVPTWFSKLAPPDRLAASSRLVEEQATWYGKNVTNANGRELLVKLALLEPYHWSREISSAAYAANVSPCPYADSHGPIIPSEAVVIDSAYLDGIDPMPIVALTKDSISIDGNEVVKLRNGTVDASEIEGGARGIKISRLSAHNIPEPPESQVRTFEVGGPSPRAISIFAEPTTSYRLLFQTISSLRWQEASFRRFSLLVASKEGTLASLPMVFPEPAVTGIDMDKLPLGLTVSLTDKQLLLWSISGEEGTLEVPSLVIQRDPTKSDEYDFLKLSDKLAEIIERRWPDKIREPMDYDLFLMADGNTPYRIVVELMAATQKTHSGQLQFSTLFAKPLN